MVYLPLNWVGEQKLSHISSDLSGQFGTVPSHTAEAWETQKLFVAGALHLKSHVLTSISKLVHSH